MIAPLISLAAKGPKFSNNCAVVLPPKDGWNFFSPKFVRTIFFTDLFTASSFFRDVISLVKGFFVKVKSKSLNRVVLTSVGKASELVVVGKYAIPRT